jgi:hypothetical protein
MFGRYQAVFRSRWRAVLWSMGVLLTAYCTVPSEGDSSDAEQIAAIAAAAGGHSGEEARAEPHHVNPWALPPEQQRH